jgi:D-amino-acid dehydrogenase
MNRSPERVVVIGGGVIGGMCAYYLRKAGSRVTIIDQGTFGGACSHGNCGYICPSHVLPLATPSAMRSTWAAMLKRNSPLSIRPGLNWSLWSWLLKFAGQCNARTMLARGAEIAPLLNASKELYAELIEREQIDCEWEKQGLLFVFGSQREMESYAATDRLLREHFHMPAVRYDGPALTRLEPALKENIAAGGWHYEGDSHLRPDRLMQELRRVLLASGVEIQEGCEFTGFSAERSVSRAAITTRGEFTADAFVVAAGAWTGKMSRLLGGPIPIQPGKGYSLTMPRPQVCPRIPLIFEEERVAITPWRSGYRIGSTMELSGYDARLNRTRLGLLRTAAEKYLREPTGEPLQEEWYGWRPMTYDSKPIIGPSLKYENVYLAAGHGMLGISMAPATGRMIADLATSTAPFLPTSPYSATRFS